MSNNSNNSHMSNFVIEGRISTVFEGAVSIELSETSVQIITEMYNKLIAQYPTINRPWKIFKEKMYITAYTLKKDDDKHYILKPHMTGKFQLCGEVSRDGLWFNMTVVYMKGRIVKPVRKFDNIENML